MLTYWGGLKMNDTRPKTVGMEIKKLSHLIMREISKMSKDMPIPSPPTEMQVRVVDYLLRAGGQEVVQKDLEEAFTIRKSTVSRLLDSLEQKGIVKRLPVSGDARLKRLVIADEALENHTRMMKKAAEMENRMLEGVTEEERETFFRVIDKIKDNLK